MASKLAYLSKYTVDQNEDADKRNKEKKRKKKSNKEKKIIKMEIREFDDDTALPPLPTDNDDEDEEDDQEENRPILVDTVLSSDQPKRQQRWKEEVLTKANTIQSQPLRQRYDSDDDEPSRQTKQHNDVPEVLPSTRYRYDSDDDSDDDEPTKDANKSVTQKQRYDSQYDQPSKRTKHYDSDDDDDDDDDDNDTQDRMSSGHIAGIQKASDFRNAERTLQKSKQEAAQAMVDRHGIGETIHRDDHGRKVQESQTKNRATISKQDQVSLNKGRAQKDEEVRLRQQFKELNEGTFARHVDDGTMNSMFKDQLRDGDPMAAYAGTKPSTRESDPTLPPRYKGPPPKPNRYGIRPGYRWDGVDRGNGFEDKVLGLKFSAQRKKEDSYRWSSADM